MDIKLSQSTVADMVTNGEIVPGRHDSPFGVVEIKAQRLGDHTVHTVWFEEIDEKWMVDGGDVFPVRQSMPVTDQPPTVMPGGIPSMYDDLKLPTEPLTSTRRDKPPVKATRQQPTIKAAKETVKAIPNKESVPEAVVKDPKPKPLHDQTGSKIHKAKVAGAPIPEQPPTIRARMGQPAVKAPTAKVIKGPSGITKALKVPLPVKQAPTARKPIAPLNKIGPKPPVWRRQLDWNGHPEKVDINLFPVKIICPNDGQVRYTTPNNAAHKTHPVRLCKPCQIQATKKWRSDKANKRNKERRKALAAAKCSPVAPRKAPVKAPSKAQKGRSGSKVGKPIPRTTNRPKKGR